MQLGGQPWEGHPLSEMEKGEEQSPHRRTSSKLKALPALYLLYDLGQVTWPLCGSVPTSLSGDNNSTYQIGLFEDYKRSSISSLRVVWHVVSTI